MIGDPRKAPWDDSDAIAPWPTGPVVGDRCLEYLEWPVSILFEYGIDPSLHGGIERYLKDRIRPGSFLSAVLSNDLREAILRAATPEVFRSIAPLVRFLVTEAPDQAHGSPANVEAWLAGKPWEERTGRGKV